jgi:hypothetical protein
VTTVQADVQKLDTTKRQQEDEIRGLQAVLDTLSEQQRTALVDKTLQQRSETAALLPRIYLQIVQKEDRTFAQGIAGRLRDAGFLVVGIEYVVPNPPLDNSDVRFYHKAEQPANRVQRRPERWSAAPVPASRTPPRRSACPRRRGRWRSSG